MRMHRILIAVIVIAALCAGAISALAAQGTRVNVTLREFKVLPSKASAKAGRITFVATNRGTVAHELELVRWARSPRAVPVRNNRASFDERREVGEVEDIRPGRTKRFTVRARAGKYLLLCNVPGHFQAGQRTRFTVRR
jgi:uncharacterized cupredoxin-like copper-binding protein